MQRRDLNRKRCLTQHHGKIAPALPVADILTSGKEGKGAVMGADALFFAVKTPPPALNPAGKPRWRLRGGRLLAQPSAQFQSEIALWYATGIASAA